MIEIGYQAELSFIMDAREVDVPAHFDQVMGELVDLVESDSRLDDPAVSLDMGQRRALVELTVRGDSFDDALEYASASVRTAAHAAGISTPDWGLEKRSQRAELADA